MTERKQGLFGGLLGQRGDDGNGRDSGSNEDPPANPGLQAPGGEGDVEAYEQDWYRSLKALAERQQQLEAELAEERTPAAAEAPADTLDRDSEAGLEPVAPADISGPLTRATGQDATTAPTEPVVDDAMSRPAEAAPSLAASLPPTLHPEPAEHPSHLDEAAPRAAVPTAAPPPEPAIATGSGADEAMEAQPPSLTSRSVDARRKALSDLIGKGLSEAETDQISALLVDPDREIRRQALDALVEIPERVSDDLIRQVLADPADEVRAAAVRLAASRGGRDLTDLGPLVAARRWPLTQQAALAALPEVLHGGDALNDEQLDALLSAVGRLESPPTDDERPALRELAGAIGASRLIGTLSGPNERRLGSVRLLAAMGSQKALRALAALATDPIEEIRVFAAAAAPRVSEPEPGPANEGDAERAFAVEQAAEVEMITALVRALQDTDPAVRERAKTALAEINRALILDWVREALRSEDPDLASLAARAAGKLGLPEAAGDILARGAALPSDARGPFLDALAPFAAHVETLAGALPAVDPSRRPVAIRMLWQVCEQAALPYVRACVADPSAPVRATVLEVLGASGDPAAAGLSKNALASDSSPAVRTGAVLVLARAGVEERAEALSRAMRDPDPGVRATAIETLPQGDVEFTPLLHHALADLDERVREVTVRQLATLPDGDLSEMWATLRQEDPAHREQLIADFARETPEKIARLALDHVRAPDPDERALAVELAGRAATEPCIGASIQALQDPATAVRRAATAALGILRSPSAVGALGGSLQDPDPEVRGGAVRALGVIDHESVLGLLVSALQDPEIAVRRVASEVLTQWSSPAVAKRLAEVLAAPDLRGQATELLTKMGPSAVELMIDVLRFGSADVAAAVGRLLEQVAGLDRFLERLSSMDPGQRLRAAEATGAIGGPAAVDGLVRSLSDPDERVRERAVQLLGHLGDTRALEALKRSSLTDPVPKVADAAQEAVARLTLGGDALAS